MKRSFAVVCLIFSMALPSCSEEQSKSPSRKAADELTDEFLQDLEKAFESADSLTIDTAKTEQLK